MLKQSAKQSRNTKVMALIVALILMCGITAMGTYAWIVVQTDSLTNTFASAALFDNCAVDFTLYESQAVYDENLGIYSLHATETTKSGNTYSIFPGVNIPKNPTVQFQNLNENAYLYIEVTANLPTGVTYSIDSNKWEYLKGNIWVYKGEYSTDYIITAANDLRTISILENNQIVVGNSYSPSSAFELKFNAYMIQAEYNGSSPGEAWNNIFATN